MMPLRIDASALARYARSLDEARRLFPRAQAALLNNAAFGVRETALEWGIPRVMVVRAPRFLAANLRVTKASPGRLVARLGSVVRDRYTGLEEQEFGGDMDRHPATELARGGNRTRQIRPRARLRGNILSPDDVEMAHIKSESQRWHVFLEVLARRNEKRPFLLKSGWGGRPGLMQYGKLIRGARRRVSGRSAGARRDAQRHGYVLAREKATATTRQIKTLQQFDAKGKTRVRKRQWMKPSLARWFDRADLQMEYARALRFARLWQSRRKV